MSSPLKIAVIGALGQLGSQIVNVLGHETTALDLPGFDLTDRSCVVDQLMELGPQVIVNTAAYTLVDRAEEEPDRARTINVDGVAHLIEACRKLDAAFVQISTDYVFGGDITRARPYRENDAPNPLNVYGHTKLKAEKVVANWEKHLIVRTSGLYGPAAPRGSGNFAATMLRLAKNGKKIKVVDDQYCSPSYTPNVAQAIAWLIGQQSRGTYHIVNRGAVSWYDFAAELFRLADLSVELTPCRSDQYPCAARRPGYSVLDTSRYDSLPDRYEMPDWHNALAEYIHAEIG